MGTRHYEDSLFSSVTLLSIISRDIDEHSDFGCTTGWVAVFEGDASLCTLPSFFAHHPFLLSVCIIMFLSAVVGGAEGPG